MKDKKDVKIKAKDLRVNYKLEFFLTNESLIALHNSSFLTQTVFNLNDYGLKQLISGLGKIGIKIHKVYENYTRHEPIDITERFKSLPLHQKPKTNNNKTRNQLKNLKPIPGKK